ncbi:ion transporter [Aquimarina sp. MMG015]|uniref:ion channel n=1 Tax=Aquimarina TaxID=290174 RepID=UPI0003F76C3E|nr:MULTISPECIES: ion channel [Aquimarina]AXT54787.1 ion transporter [Aquimarina sp. AD1]MBQ4804803.1 ion transporter [Aquimarina sp. MMG015]RKN15540.1 ion transporter [Aquimarina sp. AD1]
MAKKIKDPGIGLSSNKRAKRFINKDGSFNIKHLNRRTSISRSYNYLISISWFKFFCWVFLGYVFINSVFAIIYVLVGISAITVPTGSIIGDFMKAFFFSAQTVTTVGYGAMAPKGVVFGVISSIEALIGLLSFSFITGLLYGRFSKPKSSIRFSDIMVLREHNNVNSIMFRLMSRSTNVMIRPKVEVTLALSQKTENDKYVNNFYNLKLERNEITYLPTTWTVVHPINESSPLSEFKKEELPQLHGEILILVTYYDESFAQEVHQVHSYMLHNLNIDKAFIPAFHYDEEGFTVLDHDKIGETKTL